MKTNIIITSAALVLFASTAFATVGGPINVFDLRFDAKTNSVYYQIQSYGGRGCPPMLMKLSVSDNTVKEIVPCENDEELAQKKISDIVRDFLTIYQIHLRKNNISINVEEKGVSYWEGTQEMIKRSFVANIFQNNEKITSIPFSGCNLDQPIVVDGYNIPGVTDTIVFLLSTKGDCFEGGYVYESLHAVSGLSIISDTNMYAYKTDGSLVPHEGSLVLYPTVVEDKKFPLTSVIVGLVAFIFGGLVSLIFRKR